MCFFFHGAFCSQDSCLPRAARWGSAARLPRAEPGCARSVPACSRDRGDPRWVLGQQGHVWDQDTKNLRALCPPHQLHVPLPARAHLRPLPPLRLRSLPKAFYFCPRALAAAAIPMGTPPKSVAMYPLGSSSPPLPRALYSRPVAAWVQLPVTFLSKPRHPQIRAEIRASSCSRGFW